MKQIEIFVGVLLLTLAACAASADDIGGLEGALRQVVEKNLAAYNAEDAAGTLATVHTSSPAYGNLRDALPVQFGALNTYFWQVSDQYLKNLWLIQRDEQFVHQYTSLISHLSFVGDGVTVLALHVFADRVH